MFYSRPPWLEQIGKIEEVLRDYTELSDRYTNVFGGEYHVSLETSQSSTDVRNID